MSPIPSEARLNHPVFIALALLVTFAAVLLFRPLLPVDETRYLTVAWEMYLKHDWALLSMNFEPYHHKPPLLFWLINGVWSVFGVSRWAAMIPLYAAALSSLYLCSALGARLFPEGRIAMDRLPVIMLGSLPFLIYSGMVMFDTALMAIVLGVLICLLHYARRRSWIVMAAMGLLLGMGVLTKGPVAYLYTIFPMLMAPLWLRAEDDRNLVSWYGGCLGAILISALPVLAWLVPTLREASHDFAFWLVWNQTAGRITGNFSGAHIRPVYFYMLFLPLLCLPWAFLPDFWHNVKALWRTLPGHSGFRFLLCWLMPTFLAFSFISGKQPHYLLPLLPGILITMAILLKDTSLRTLTLTTGTMIALIVGGQAIASRTVLRAYDLAPAARYVAAHPENEWAFAGKYQGELGFLAALQNPVTPVPESGVAQWLGDHPNGRVVFIHKEKDMAHTHYTSLLHMPYRDRFLDIFAK